MEFVERKFYTMAKIKMVVDEINMTEDEREEEREGISAMLQLFDEQMQLHPPKPDPAKIEWFEGLVPSAIEFAKSCDLDMKMRISDEQIGYLTFETSFFDMGGIGDQLIRRFWVYLCSRGQLSITQKEEVFSMEFLFDLQLRD